MKVKSFGMVTVYVEEGRWREPIDTVEINWSCCGSVDINDTQKFYNDFTEALIFAAQERKRLGIEED